MGLTSSVGVISSSGALTEVLHNGNQPSPFMNSIKGAMNENLMEEALTRGLAGSPGKWMAGTPARIGNQGIDGLYFRTDGQGNIRSLLVAEAKYGSSGLGTTSSGQQMSERWISGTPGRSSGLYKGFADRIKTDGAIRASGLEKVGVKGIVRVPLGQGQTAEVWESGGKIKYFCSDNTVTMKEIQRQTARAAQDLAGAAERKIDFRSRLFRFSSEGNTHSIEITEWNPKTQSPMGEITKIKGPLVNSRESGNTL